MLLIVHLSVAERCISLNKDISECYMEMTDLISDDLLLTVAMIGLMQETLNLSVGYCALSSPLHFYNMVKKFLT